MKTRGGHETIGQYLSCTNEQMSKGSGGNTREIMFSYLAQEPGKRVLDVQCALIDNFLDGTELYARHFRNYEAYRSFEPLPSDEEL
jgi:hypothetical protein